MREVNFLKMQAIGNDFVVLDLRGGGELPGADFIKFACDRHVGVGCDQFVTIHDSGEADVRVRFFNPDASESGACGNATRCVANFIMLEKETDHVGVQTNAGVLSCSLVGEDVVAVNMGKAKASWEDIPLREECDTLSLDISVGNLAKPVAVSMGNPHAVFFVDVGVDEVDLELLGPKLECNEIFPERANIGVANVRGKSTMFLRVWERGVGETLACGSGACAAVVAAVRRGLCDKKVEVILPGGSLNIEIQDNGDVMMIGAAKRVFSGVIDGVGL